MNLKYLPNLLTCLRVILTPPLLVVLLHEQYVIAFIICFVAGISDAADGFLARYLGCNSRFGAIADPLADKFLLISVFIVFYKLGLTPLWFVLMVIARDAWVFFGALTYHVLFGPYDFNPNWNSKINTFLQIALIAVMLVNLGFFPVASFLIPALTYAVIMSCALSAVEYTWVWGRRGWQRLQASAESRQL